MLGLFVTVITLSALIEKVQPYSEGAPYSTCFTMYPHHHYHPKQETKMPYTVNFSKPSFSDGETITITITANHKSKPIRGIMLAARRATMNTQDFVGQFTQFDEWKIQAFSCFGGYHNMITHTNGKHVYVVQLEWKAPTTHVGDVVFWATLMESFGTFWVAEKIPFPTSTPNETIVHPTYPTITVTPMVKETDFSSCGVSKGCFLYPSNCDGHNCIAAASYQYISGTDEFLFEMFTKQGPSYVSLGISYDQKMGNDLTVSCVVKSGILSVQQGTNPGYHNEFQYTRSISEREIMQKDGNIHCRFYLSAQAKGYLINQTADGYQSTDLIFNLHDSWYLMLAWGRASEGSVFMGHHKDMPATSFSKINLKEHKNSFGSAFPIMVRVHASLMIIAWVLFTGLVTVIARHYKEWFPKRRLFGTKIWFQVHRALGILVAILTIIGIIIIFAYFGKSELRKSAGNHAKVGLAVLACVCVQLIAGFLRPGPDSKVRPFFNWGHRFLGHAGHILSAATMFLVFDFKHLTPDLKRFGTITLGVWVGGQTLWHIIFEVYRFYVMRKSQVYYSMNYDMSPGTAPSTPPESIEKKRNVILDNALTTAYILCLFAFTTSIMVYFLVY